MAPVLFGTIRRKKSAESKTRYYKQQREGVVVKIFALFSGVDQPTAVA